MILRKSVKSLNQWQSVIQTSYDIINAHDITKSMESGKQIETEFYITLLVQ